jgi:hypothetical protein
MSKQAKYVLEGEQIRNRVRVGGVQNTTLELKRMKPSINSRHRNTKV